MLLYKNPGRKAKKKKVTHVIKPKRVLYLIRIKVNSRYSFIDGQHF